MVYKLPNPLFLKGIKRMSRTKKNEPNCITELTDLKQKAVMYHQDTIDRLVEENIKLKESYEAKLEKYEVALQEIYQLCADTLYIDDREAISNIMHIIEGVLKKD